MRVVRKCCECGDTFPEKNPLRVAWPGDMGLLGRGRRHAGLLLSPALHHPRLSPPGKEGEGEGGGTETRSARKGTNRTKMHSRRAFGHRLVGLATAISSKISPGGRLISPANRGGGGEMPQQLPHLSKIDRA